ncbi:DUF421 domain-containing protein [Acetonema longum]|uniref:YetF C-terminal domain-containing protein n=1 Tax=Acetonema longum DSM 6540 TaxID=1009370 RepID=F7NNF2_9FIRM|nr:YetF domain-containing protein [Acetonema longum]EGO62393.1 hypothetical protein ALO_18215 [Acetonema longum DSM 6540]
MLGYEHAGQVLLRMAGIFAIALIVVRIMGNRTVGQFSPFDFVLMVGVGDIVGNIAMDQRIHVLVGVEALIGLLILQQVLSYLSLKNNTLRKWFEGVPVELIEDGRIIRENFVKSRFNFDDLRQELHKQGLDFTNIKDIKLARLESCGDLTVIRSPEIEPLTKREFDEYLRNIYDNPLSPLGEKWVQMEQLAQDVRYLTEYIRRKEQIETLDTDSSQSKENLQ